MSSDEDDMPLAARLAARGKPSSSLAKQHTAGNDVLRALAGDKDHDFDRQHPARLHPARLGVSPRGSSAVQCASITRGPMRLLNQDLLLNIYGRAPRKVIAHSRVCKYFYSTLSSASRIDIHLGPEAPCRLTSSLARFVKGSHQKIALSIGDSTALKTLRGVLESDGTQASVPGYFSYSYRLIPLSRNPLTSTSARPSGCSTASREEHLFSILPALAHPRRKPVPTRHESPRASTRARET